MRKRATMNKNIALIIASAIIVGQLPTTVLAEGVKTAIVQQEVISDEDVKPYIQNYDRPEGITWTTLGGNGTVSVSDGNLVFKNNGDFRIMEDQSPEIRNGELEAKFTYSSDRVGVMFRATKTDAGMVLYDTNGSWVIQNNTEWNSISGPTLNEGDEVIVKVRFQEKHIVVNVSVNEAEFEKIFDGELDLIPLQAGKLGYRGWNNSKTTNFDYVKYAPITVDHGAITSVQDVNIETRTKVKPNLPSTVTVNYEDTMSGIKEVSWNYIPKESYSKPGTFDVEGTVVDTDIKAVAHVTVTSDLLYYETDFESEETRGDWQLAEGKGQPSYENGSVVVPMNGVANAVDMKSPDVKDFIYETDFTVSNDSGRIGLLFRYASNDDWAAICYDAGAWVWKAENSGEGSYGGFPGSFKLEANKKYRMKIKVEDANVTLWIDGEKVGQTTIANLPDMKGKIGLSGWFGNKNVTLDNVVVQELGGLTAPDVGPLEEQVIESDTMKVVLDNRFPTVVRYEWKGSEDSLAGASVDDFESQYIVEINGDKYVPTVESSINNNEALYTLDFKDIGMTIKLKMTVDGNKLRMDVTDIKEGEVKLQKLNFPNHSLASVTSLENGKTASVLTTGDWNNINEDFTDVASLRPGVKGKTYAFINNDKFAVTVNNNTIEGGNRVVLTTENDTKPDNTNYKKVGISNGAWTYREVLEDKTAQGSSLYQGEKPWSEVIIARDENKDGEVDWQDGAIKYRENMVLPVGGTDIKNQLSRIDFNIGYTQNPFLRSLDQVKKISNFTDNFGQLVLHKGYQAEGHDDSHPDFGGHIGIRQGGKEDFNTLINEGKKYNASIGVHINATEYMKDAFQYPGAIVNENAPGWGWLDQAYYVDQRADIMTGELFRRLDMLKDDAPDLGWVYVDVYTGNGWNAHQLANKINDLGYMVATEMNGPLEQHVPWTHWGGDPAYPNKGNASKIMRLMKNDTQDSFLADPLVKGNKHLLSGGWGSRHSVEGEYGTEVFYNQVLPTKYLQHFPIIKMSDNEVLFENGVKSAREGANINYYRNDRLVATTPEASIGNTGIGDTLLFLPWNPVDEAASEKIYHWNPLGTTSEWTLPEGWDNLSTIQLYELSDIGRTLVKDVQVVNGKVTLEVEKDTPYIVTKGEVEETRITDWGIGAQIKDPGFDSQTWDNWNVDSEEGNINIVNETHARREGNDVVEIGEKDGSISQSISDLTPGMTYSISTWVKNENNREVTLKVNCGSEEVSNVITQASKVRQGQGVKFLGDNFTRMEVEFTVPDGVKTAEISLDVKTGEEASKVIVDDFRIWDHPGHTNKDGYAFYEDFENVDEGINPFYLAPGRGESNRSHLAEKDLNPNTMQKMNWVIDGRFALKTNQQPGEQGEMLITEGATFKLEANKEYELGFLYTLADAAPGYTVNIKSKSEGTIATVSLGASNEAKSVTKTFTTGDAKDYYISIDKGNGYKELIIDNIYVKELDNSVETPELEHVNFNTMLNQLEVGQVLDVDVTALMNNGADADLSNVEYVVSNPEVVSVVDGKMTAIADGKAKVSVNVTVDGKTVSSNKVVIQVGEVDEEIPEIDKSELEGVIDSTTDLNKDKYTEESWNVFEEALNNANTILAKVDATQEEVNAAKSELEEAIKNLQEKVEDIVVSKVKELKGTATDSTVNLTWKAPNTATGLEEYIIYKDGKELTKVSAEKTEFTVEDLKANTIYGFKIVTKYSNGEKSKPVSLNIRTKKANSFSLTNTIKNLFS